MSHFFKIIKGILIVAALLAVAACGGSSGDGAPATGQVSVIITDGPAEEYDQVLITLSSMTLIGSGGQEVVYDGEPITFDLLQLRHRADFAFSQQIAVGDYNKIRLEVTEVKLVDLGDLGIPEDDVEVTLDKLPANGKIDLNPQGPFEIVADRATVIELDMDARRSFQAVETGNSLPDDPRLKFRPVIFVNVYDDEIVLPDRMTRVFGTVEDVTVENVDGVDSLLLCNLQFVAQFSATPVTDTDSCVRVFANEMTSHFDVGGLALTDFAALAAAIQALQAQDPEGEAQLMAIGFPSLPDGVDGVDGDVVLELDAVVSELGPRKTDMNEGWETTDGTIVAVPSDTCSTQPAQPCVDFQPATAASALTVQLQDATRVFARDGTILDQNALAVGVTGAFDGWVDQDGTGEMRAALFITDTFAGSELVSGMLVDVTLGEPLALPFDRLTVQPDPNDPISVVEVCVDGDSDLLRILVDDVSITIVDLLDPAVLDPNDMLLVEAAGEPGTDDACDIDANVVIIE
jgi:hypothetical protein